MDPAGKNWKYFEYPSHYSYEVLDEKYYADKDDFPDLTIKGESGLLFIPDIVGLASKDFFGIRGQCYMSGVQEFFAQVFQWLEHYFTKNPTKIRVEFWLSYYNTSASRIFLIILKAFDKYQIENEDVEVNVFWYFPYDDLGIKEDAEDYQRDLKSLKLNIIPTDYESDYYEDMTKIFNI